MTTTDGSTGNVGGRTVADQKFINDVGDRVTEARHIKGKPTTWLALQSGIEYGRLRRRIAAPEQYTLAELSALARTLNVPLESLFNAGDREQRLAG